MVDRPTDAQLSLQERLVLLEAEVERLRTLVDRSDSTLDRLEGALRSIELRLEHLVVATNERDRALRLLMGILPFVIALSAALGAIADRVGLALVK